MRLVSAHLRGYGRLVDSKINLDAKVIAIVGPNEAGKTTLLNALSHIDRHGSIPRAERSRAVEVTDATPIVTLDFVLDDSDRDYLDDLDLHEAPARAFMLRRASGKRVIVEMEPVPVKSVSALEEAVKQLASFERDEVLGEWVDESKVYADSPSGISRDYTEDLRTVIEAARAAIDNPGSVLAPEFLERAKLLLDSTFELVDTGGLRSALAAIIEWAEREDPYPAARKRVWENSPDFILFEQADRSLMSSYKFDEALVADPPAALANLAGAAQLDLNKLLDYVNSGDLSRRRTAILQANNRLDAIFEASWKQSRLSVHFEIDGDQLRVEPIEDGEFVTVFDERSAGLRIFVALIAFLRNHGPVRPPVLLIDEAESHLHINAQADLVNMFVSQEYAVKVIYTTHSPACLPPDLGTSIRTVVPRKDDLYVSDVKNNFWQGAAGYSPLMLAMGAAAAAFTPARNVVLAEGATEMILLPSLIRAATGSLELPYQIAPGLSEVPKDLLHKLDLEAARVAYLVDSDSGGEGIRNSLVRAGVPASVIVSLGVPGIENLLDSDSYRSAFSALIPECNRGNSNAVNFQAPVLADEEKSWSKWMDALILERNLIPPSKVAVANWLVQNGQARPSVDGATLLQRLNLRILEALG